MALSYSIGKCNAKVVLLILKWANGKLSIKVQKVRHCRKKKHYRKYIPGRLTSTTGTCLTIFRWAFAVALYSNVLRSPKFVDVRLVSASWSTWSPNIVSQNRNMLIQFLKKNEGWNSNSRNLYIYIYSIERSSLLETNMACHF